jgi:hypothetical protein
MGSPYLNSNESIVLSTHNVVINTIPAEAILTNQRLILVDSRHTQLRPQDIPFTAIETVTIGENTEREPVLSISVVTHDQMRHPLGITFPVTPRAKRVGERDEWAVKLKEYALAAQQGHGAKPAELTPPWIPGELPPEEGAGQGAPEEKFHNPAFPPRKAKAGAGGKNRTIIAAGVVLLAIIALAAGVFFLAPGILGNHGGTASTVVTPVATPTATPLPATTAPPATGTTQSPEPSVATTTEVTATATQAGIPQDEGVWVQIDYAGNFTGSFGVSGRMKEVTASGNQYYQVPAKNEIIDALIQKLDESGNTLTVSVYNDGQLVTSSTVAKPHGTVEIHADLRKQAAVTQAAVTTNQTSQ